VHRSQARALPATYKITISYIKYGSLLREAVLHLLSTYPNSVRFRTDANCYRLYDYRLVLIRVYTMNQQQTANHKVGVWIDHREAFVVFSNEPTIKEHSISSGIEKHIHYAGHGSESEAFAEDQREKHHEHNLERYYDDVIEYIHGATAIFIFGPGEAKGEFKKRIEHKGMGDQIAGIEAADNLTNNQIAAKVEAFFHK
jgi:hypothetical protein